jgi:hypothetical protein
MIDPPENCTPSPVGVAIDPDGVPWTCAACASGSHAPDECPGKACLCGCNQHGKVIVTLDGGVRDMPQFAERFRRRYRTASVTIQIPD